MALEAPMPQLLGSDREAPEKRGEALPEGLNAPSKSFMVHNTYSGLS